MTEFERARAWREARGLSVRQLSDLTGYGVRAIHWMERGEAPPNRTLARRPVAAVAWQRYRMACAGVDAQMRRKQPFNWGQ